MYRKKILIILPEFIKNICLNLMLNMLKEKNYEVIAKLYNNILTENELIQYLIDIDGYIAGYEKITPRVVKYAKRLKVISEFGVGVDNINLGAASKEGIIVCNTEGVNTYAVAEMTIALMLSLVRDLPNINQSTKRGKWERKVTGQLRGRTLGIIGVGNIGKQVVKIASNFQMKIIGYDILKDEYFLKNNIIEYCSFKEVLQNSDFVCIHLPLTNKTGKMFSTEEFKNMKSTAYLLNLSRGGIVDEEALYKALKNKIIAGAALDVLSKESPGANCLFNLENTIITPHVAALTYETMMETGKMAAENIIEVLEKGNCSRVVNNEMLS